MYHTLAPDGHSGHQTMGYTFVTGVFAIEAFAEKNLSDTKRLWSQKPRGHIGGGEICFLP